MSAMAILVMIRRSIGREAAMCRWRKSVGVTVLFATQVGVAKGPVYSLKFKVLWALIGAQPQESLAAVDGSD